MEGRNSVSVIYSNLQKAAEKQQKPGLVDDYSQLSGKFKDPGTTTGTLDDLFSRVTDDLSNLMPRVKKTAQEEGDRGGQRVIKWGETVGKIQKSLIDRYMKKGDEAFESKDFYVCQACGFIYVGTEAPKICAACKAPSNRFEKIK